MTASSVSSRAEQTLHVYVTGGGMDGVGQLVERHGIGMYRALGGLLGLLARSGRGGDRALAVDVSG